MTVPTNHPSSPEFQIAYGPVPSRRLGRSLGINNIPPKYCSYACSYCQLGPTIRIQTHRSTFYPAEAVIDAIQNKVDAVRNAGETIDYITFVPDGEPTLDIDLGREIRGLKHLGIKIAVITNSSLIWDEKVRDELSEADWVSLKVDAVDRTIWRTVDHPARDLVLDRILEGADTFSRTFPGTLVTETMLVADVNTGPDHLAALASYISGLTPETAFLSVPTRPPAQRSVRPPDEAETNCAFQAFSSVIPHVECLLGYEGNAFASTGSAEDDLLSITAVHPMREDAVETLLQRTGSSWNVVDRLVADGRLVQTHFGGHAFFIRKLRTS